MCEVATHCKISETLTKEKTKTVSRAGESQGDKMQNLGKNS